MILAVTVDLPTILPLKASFESGLLERSDHYLKYSCGKRRKKTQKNNLTLSLKKRDLHLQKYIYQKQYIIELHLLNKKK